MVNVPQTTTVPCAFLSAFVTLENFCAGILHFAHVSNILSEDIARGLFGVTAQIFLTNGFKADKLLVTSLSERLP